MVCHKNLSQILLGPFLNNLSQIILKFQLSTELSNFRQYYYNKQNEDF